MDIRKIILVLCFAFSCNVFADNASPVLFDQVLNLKSDQAYELALEDVQPSDQIWTAVYLIGRQNYPGPTSKVDFVIDNQGLLNKVKPTEKTISQTLIAENLVQSNNYSFNQFKELKKLLDKNGVNTIEDPAIREGDEIRVYSQVNDWIPEYNSYESPMVKFSVTKPVDFDIVAAYVFVGKGPKPTALNELNFTALTPAQAVPAVANASQQATVTTPVQTQTSVEPNNEIKASDHGLSRLEMKVLVFVLVSVMMALFAFINRKKVKQAF